MQKWEMLRTKFIEKQANLLPACVIFLDENTHVRAELKAILAAQGTCASVEMMIPIS